VRAFLTLISLATHNACGLQQLQQQHQEWELLAGKARRWLSLALRGAIAQATVESILDDAGAFLSSKP
jgi:hypothetical protein